MAYPVLPGTDALPGIVQNDVVQVVLRLFKRGDIGEAARQSVGMDCSPTSRCSKPRASVEG
eukprot:10567792-Alexandrium_andersonii.AAC.1